MHIKVKPGYVIRDPRTKVNVPDEGMTVADDDLFYTRRIAEGSVEVVPEEAAPETREME